MRHLVQLITYPDRLGGDLTRLRQLLEQRFAGVFGGIHVLPFFTPIDGADAGFDPIDHRQVDPRMGTWDDVSALASGRDLCADLIVNHTADGSPWFQDLVRRGAESPYAGMFLTFDRVFPDGATEEELLAIYRPRPGLPFTVKTIAARPRLLWTTFSGSQIDLDVSHPAARQALTEVLELMAAHGVTCVRLDAVGYAVKTRGTSCFMTPQTVAFIRDLSDQAGLLGLKVLVEVHSHYRHQVDLAGKVDLVYDFALPPLVLHAVHSGDVDPLLTWLQLRPHNAVTVLDTHDGIGMVDVAADQDPPGHPGLLTADQVHTLVESLHTASNGVSRRATGAAARNLDVYQVNCAWYDAVGRDDARMCLTRLIQLLTPGIPQIYYQGLLAGTNDEELLAATGNGRDVNRHRYDGDEVDAALERPVVAATIAAILLRNTHPAFGGSFSCGAGTDAGSMWMSWRLGSDEVALSAEPGQSSFRLTWTDGDVRQRATCVQELAGA